MEQSVPDVVQSTGQDSAQHMDSDVPSVINGTILPGNDIMRGHIW